MIDAKPLRPVGVQTANELRSQEVPAQTLLHAAPVEWFAIRYGGADGRAHDAIVMKAGDQWYMPPDTEAYAAKLRPMSKWLSDLMKSRVPSTTTVSEKDLPKETVEVIK